MDKVDADGDGVITVEELAVTHLGRFACSQSLDFADIF